MKTDVPRVPGCVKVAVLVMASYTAGMYTGGWYSAVLTCTKTCMQSTHPQPQILAEDSVIDGQRKANVTVTPPIVRIPATRWPYPGPPDIHRREKYPSAAGLHMLKLSDLEVRNNMSKKDAENTFYNYLRHCDVTCEKHQRFGHGAGMDGGWDVCVSGPYDIQKPCLVYSFGISNDWSFDDAISQKRNCVIRAFDPSIGKKDHIRGKKGLIHFYSRGLGGSDVTKTVRRRAWQLRTFSTLRKAFHETETTVDYLKIDVEFSEWGALKTMLAAGILRSVKQIGFEIHTREIGHVGSARAVDDTSVRDFTGFYETLRGLESLGFRKWYSHSNPMGMYTSARTRLRRSCCFEMVYINANLLLNPSG